MELRPGTIAVLAGGVLLFISTFLDWFGTFSVYEGRVFGFAGILLLLIALDVVIVTALRTFAPQVNLPSSVAGFTLDQGAMALGFAAFVYGFSMMFVENSEFGAVLAWIGGAAIAVGGYLESRAATTGAASTI